MNRELLMLVDAISREKTVERDVVFGAVEAALAQPAFEFCHRRRHHEHADRVFEVALDLIGALNVDEQ